MVAKNKMSRLLCKHRRYFCIEYEDNDITQLSHLTIVSRTPIFRPYDLPLGAQVAGLGCETATEPPSSTGDARDIPSLIAPMTPHQATVSSHITFDN